MCGIILAMYVGRKYLYFPLNMVFVISLLALSIIISRIRFKFVFRWLPGVIIFLSLCAIGFINTNLHNPGFTANHIIHAPKIQLNYLVQITEPISEKANSFKVLARAIAWHDSLKWKQVDGQILLYFEKDSTVLNYEYGAQLIVNTQLNPISPPKNPKEFNYGKYLSNKGIYSQGYVRVGMWQVLTKRGGNPLSALGYSLRKKFSDILEDNGIKGEEFSVASAILLGYDEYLDADQRKDFAGAGAMHILCVSGLHVGIIYVILNNLLLFLNRKRVLRIIKVIVLLVLIWTYALITGLSPSVMRASTMFSFIIVGNSLKRKANIYNSIAASAFVLMIINPYIITQVGFQLSYLAVLGIVLLYKPIARLFDPGNLIIRWIWQISVVSIAATLATFPLSLYYFHQFPNLFLITNLIAIPASMLIIYTGILVLLLSPVPFLSTIFAKILVIIIWTLNHSVNAIEGLSFSVSENVYISTFELLVLLGITVSIVILITTFKRKYVYLLGSLIILLIMSFTFRKYESVNQKMIAVYNVNNTSAIDFINGKVDYLLTDSLFTSKMDAFYIRNFRIASGVSNHNKLLIGKNLTTESVLRKYNNFIQFYDKKFLLVNREFASIELLEKIEVNYIIIYDNPFLSIKDIQGCVVFEKVIFDSSNSYWNTKKWTQECLELGIPFYDVKERGAWIETI